MPTAIGKFALAKKNSAGDWQKHDSDLAPEFSMESYNCYCHPIGILAQKDIMPTQAELDTMNTRKNGARSAIKFFTEIRTVKSSNNIFDMLSSTQKAAFYANRPPNGAIIDDVIYSTNSGMGNCDEKGRICYAALKSNPTLNGSAITLCAAVGYDHVFVIISDAAVTAPVALNTLGVTAMIVDGWTQDWYFPNIPWYTAKKHSLGNTPNPRQLVVRTKVASHNVDTYGHVPMGGKAHH